MRISRHNIYVVFTDYVAAQTLLCCPCTWCLFLVNKVSSINIECIHIIYMWAKKSSFSAKFYFIPRAALFLRYHSHAQKEQKTASNQIWLSKIAQWNFVCVIEKKRAQLIGHWSDDQLACKNSLAIQGKNRSRLQTAESTNCSQKRRLCAGSGQQNSRCGAREASMLSRSSSLQITCCLCSCGGALARSHDWLRFYWVGFAIWASPFEWLLIVKSI